jgi:two-component system NarL family response regulator
MTAPGAGSSRLRILVADDHALLRRGLCDVLAEAGDMEVVAEASDGAEAVRLARALRPVGLDLVLMDVDMPGLDGIAAARQITAEHPDMPVVMLTVSALESDLLRAVEAGAVGFLTKSLAPDVLLRALRDFHRDGTLPMSPTMAARVLSHFRYTSRAQHGEPPARAAEESAESRLTAREREVLELVAQGARDREIASHLGLTVHTVKKHVKSLLHKFGARNRVEAVAHLRHGNR